LLLHKKDYLRAFKGKSIGNSNMDQIENYEDVREGVLDNQDLGFQIRLGLVHKAKNFYHSCGL
jgi:hypothetical protein